MRQVASGGNGDGRGRLWPLLLWVGVIAALVVPWWSYQNHSHWARVQWIPFVTPPIKLSDLIANVLVYIPFGYLSMRSTWRPRVWRGVALAFVMSATTELTQVFSHGRFPSATDLVDNVAGAWVGAELARRAQMRLLPKVPDPSPHQS